MIRLKNNGFTLFEVLVAVLLLAIISSMIYSVLNAGIRFSEQGERKILGLERELGLLSLLKRQVQGGWYDEKKKQVIISANEDLLRMVTTAPLLYPDAGVVMVFYRIDRDGDAVYYQEKRDFYNIYYDEEFEPDFEEMLLLLNESGLQQFEYDEESKIVHVTFSGAAYEFVPWSQGNKQ